MENVVQDQEENNELKFANESSTVIPVIEEHIVVDKEVVETGKVIIRKTVTQEEASINIPLIQEGYQVERRPGNEELFLQPPPIRHEGAHMIIPVVREVLVIEKRYEVIEEVRLIKTITEVPYQQEITLLKEEVSVERKETN